MTQENLHNLYEEFDICYKDQLARMHQSNFIEWRSVCLQLTEQIVENDGTPRVWFFDYNRGGARKEVSSAFDRVFQIFHCLRNMSSAQFLESDLMQAISAMLELASRLLSGNKFLEYMEYHRACETYATRYRSFMQAYFAVCKAHDGAGFGYIRKQVQDTAEPHVALDDDNDELDLTAWQLHYALHFIPLALHVHKKNVDYASQDFMLSLRPLSIVAAEHMVVRDDLRQVFDELDFENAGAAEWAGFYDAYQTLMHSLDAFEDMELMWRDDCNAAMNKWYDCLDAYSSVRGSIVQELRVNGEWFARLNRFLRRIDKLHMTNVTVDTSDANNYTCTEHCCWHTTDSVILSGVTSDCATDKSLEKKSEIAVPTASSCSASESQDDMPPTTMSVAGRSDEHGNEDVHGGDTPCTKDARVLLGLREKHADNEPTPSPLRNKMSPPAFVPTVDTPRAAFDRLCGEELVDDALDCYALLDTTRTPDARLREIVDNVRSALEGKPEVRMRFDDTPDLNDCDEIGVLPTKWLVLMPMKSRSRYYYFPVYLRKRRARGALSKAYIWMKNKHGAKWVAIQQRTVKRVYCRLNRRSHNNGVDRKRSTHTTSRKRDRDQRPLPSKSPKRICASSSIRQIDSAPQPTFVSASDDRSDECAIPGCSRSGKHICPNENCDLHARSDMQLCDEHILFDACLGVAARDCLGVGCVHCFFYGETQWHCAPCWKAANNVIAPKVHEPRNSDIQLLYNAGRDPVPCPNNQCLYSGARFKNRDNIMKVYGKRRKQYTTLHRVQPVDLVDCTSCSASIGCRICAYIVDDNDERHSKTLCAQCERKQPNAVRHTSKTTANRLAQVFIQQ